MKTEAKALFSTDRPALIIIDLQLAIDQFSSHERSNPSAELAIASFLDLWRERGLPVVHIRHSSRFVDSPYHESSDYFEFKPEVMPRDGEAVVTKRENCAFLGTDLEEQLKSMEVSELVVCGVLVNNSVDATVRVAAGLGFDVILPSDATAAFAIDSLNGKNYPAEDVHDLFLSNLHGEYAQVVDSAMVEAELKGS